MIDVKIKQLYDNVILPKKAHEDDACFDIYAHIPVGNINVSEGKTLIIEPHQTLFIQTGFATEIPEGYCAFIFARSGVASKRYLRPAQGVPVIDAGYRGEWLIPLHNDSNIRQYIMDCERIAQFMIVPVLQTNLIPVENLSDSDRGNGGFGSSGRN